MNACANPAPDADLLIYGIGNMGRQDDGLGWAFVDALESEGCLNAEFYRNYQLSLEDVELFARKKRVILIDASKDETLEGYRIRKITAEDSPISFSSHLLSVENVSSLCRSVYNVTPVIDVIEIRGYAWEIGHGLDARAQRNLEDALGGFASLVNGQGS